MLPVALVAALAGRAGAEARAPYVGTLAMGWFSAPASFDPAEAMSFAEIEAARLVYDGPFRLALSGTTVGAVPDLVVASEVAPSGRKIVLTIRGDVQFQDGSTLTADDVAASLTRGRAAPGGWLLAPIKSVRAIGQHEVELTLLRKTPELEKLLTTPAAYVLPHGRDGGRRPIGTGPFRVVAWAGPGTRSFVLEAFAAHWAGRPFLDRLEAHAYDAPKAEGGDYETGVIGWSYRGATAFSNGKPKNPTASFQSAPIATGFLGFGSDHKFMHDVDVRRAISWAIDRDAARSAGAGPGTIPAADVVPPILEGKGEHPTVPPRELAKAQATLAEVARRDTELAAFLKGGKLTILVDITHVEDNDVALKVLDMLQGAGLDGRIERLEPQEFKARALQGRCDLYIGEAFSPLPEAAFAAGAALAASGDIRRMRSELAKAPLSLLKLRQYIAEKIPLIPLFHRPLVVHHLASLRGFQPEPSLAFGLADAFFFPRPAP